MKSTIFLLLIPLFGAFGQKDESLFRILQEKDSLLFSVAFNTFVLEDHTPPVGPELFAHIPETSVRN